MRQASFAVRAALLASPALAAGPALAQDGAVPDTPIANWEVTTQFTDRGAGGAGNSVTRLYVAPGETAQQWTRQAKEVRLNSFALILSPGDAAGAAGENLKRACPETVIGPPSEHRIGNAKAVMQRADCPVNAKSGLPLVVITTGWNDDVDVQLKTVLFAFFPGPGDVALAEAFLLAPATPVDWQDYPAGSRETKPSE